MVFIAAGDSGVTATATLPADVTPIAPGEVEVIRIAGCTHIAAITDTGTSDIYFTPGAGL